MTNTSSSNSLLDQFSFNIVNGWQGLNKHSSALYASLDITEITNHKVSGVNLYFSLGKRAYGINNGKLYPNQFKQYHVYQSNIQPQALNTISAFFQTESPCVHTELFGFGIDGYSDYVDIASGVFRPQQIATKYNNYFALPFYILTLIRNISFPTLAELKNYLNELNNLRLKSAQERDLYCCLVSSHDHLQHFIGVRASILDNLNPILDSKQQQVVCGGRFCNNSDMLKVECNDNKIAFAQKFIFNVCPENSYASGYVTEKIFDAIISGCVPIYWGCFANEEHIFNPKALVYFDPHNISAFTERMQELVNSEEALEQLIQEKPFLPGAAETIFYRYFAPIYSKINQMGLSFKSIRRIKGIDENYNWQDDYQLAKQTLIDIGQNPVDFQDHMINQEFNQWPFLKADRVRVACNYKPITQQYSHLNTKKTNAESLNIEKYNTENSNTEKSSTENSNSQNSNTESTFNPIKPKPLYDSLKQELEAIQNYRIALSITQAKIKSEITQVRENSIFNSQENHPHKKHIVSQNPLSVLAFNQKYIEELIEELEDKKKVENTEISSNQVGSDKDNNYEVSNNEFENHEVNNYEVDNHEISNHEQFSNYQLPLDLIKHFSHLHQTKTKNSQQQVLDLLQNIIESDNNIYQQLSSYHISEKVLPRYLHKPSRKLKAIYHLHKYYRQALIKLGIYYPLRSGLSYLKVFTKDKSNKSKPKLTCHNNLEQSLNILLAHSTEGNKNKIQTDNT